MNISEVFSIALNSKSFSICFSAKPRMSNAFLEAKCVARAVLCAGHFKPALHRMTMPSSQSRETTELQHGHNIGAAYEDAPPKFKIIVLLLLLRLDFLLSESFATRMIFGITSPALSKTTS